MPMFKVGGGLAHENWGAVALSVELATSQWNKTALDQRHFTVPIARHAFVCV